MPRGIYIRIKPVSDETKIKIGLGNKGKIVSLKSKIKISLANKGKNFTGIENGKKTRFKNGQIPWNKGICYHNPKLKIIQKTSKFRIKQSLSHSGNKCHFWKGGITPENLRIRMSVKYKLWREAVFKRDNWTCQKCGIKNNKGVGETIVLNSHHIKSFAYYPELRFEISNGTTLCENCHKLTDNFKKKSKK